MSLVQPKSNKLLPTSDVGSRVYRRQVSGNNASQVTARRRRGALLLSAIAIAALLRLRSNYDSPLALVVETMLIVLTVAVGAWQIPRRWPASTRALAIFSSVVVSMPWLLDVIFRRFGSGNGTEIVMLGSLAWGAVLTAIFGKQSRTLSLSVVCSGFLTLFTTCISDHSIAAWFAYSYAFLCMWWLITNQWERLETCAATHIEASGTRRIVSVLLAAIVLVISTWSVAGRIPVLRQLQAELMPTSGGSSGKDAAARSGVGDGDAVVAARQHASSFGAVDTDFFLDSEQPSLFDLFSDEMGKPRKIKRQERAQALAPQQAINQDSKIAQANRSSSQSFSTSRSAPRKKQALNDLRHSAIMFWSGPAGERLAVERFQKFDGVEWTHELPTSGVQPATSTTPTPVVIGDRTWFKPPGRFVDGSLSPFVGATAEALKFTRFRSPIIPTRAGLQMWCIDDLTMADFFRFTAEDCLEMPEREHVPDYTVVRFVGSHMMLDRIEQLLTNCAPRTAPEFRPPTALEQQMKQLANEYAGDLPRGWAQVQAIIEGLRRDFQLAEVEKQGTLMDVSQAVEQELPLQSFLDQRRGPDYLFATAASEMLRQLSFETRLAIGFYANPQHREFGKTEIAILPRDAHVWLEINAGHDYWLPLEPTPGFLPPSYTASLYYRMVQAKATIAWVACGLLATIVGLYLLRRFLFEMAFQMLGSFAFLLRDRQRIIWWRWVLDRRLWLAGKSRPSNASLRSWLMSQVGNLETQQLSHLDKLLNESDRIFFGGASRLTNEGQAALRHAWRQLTVHALLRDQNHQPKALPGQVA